MSDEEKTAIDHAAQLRCAVQTACNDDVTEPGTEARRRHNERVSAMLVAIDEIERLRADLEAAQADITMLIQRETEAVNGP